jgi:hypothetical protein
MHRDVIHVKVLFSLLTLDLRIGSIKLREHSFGQPNLLLIMIRHVCVMVLCRIAHVNRVRGGSSILTIGQGRLEDKRPLIQPLCSRFDVEALGPPLFLALRGQRRSGRRLHFQCLDA